MSPEKAKFYTFFSSNAFPPPTGKTTHTHTHTFRSNEIPFIQGSSMETKVECHNFQSFYQARNSRESTETVLITVPRFAKYLKSERKKCETYPTVPVNTE